MGNDLKFEFIKESIIDSQEIIRGIDVKAGACLAVLIAPLSQLDSIWNFTSTGIEKFNSKWFVILLSTILFILWLISLTALIKTIGAINNPALHIINNTNRNGIFYSGGLYNLFFADVFSNREVIKANVDLGTFTKKFSLPEEELIDELIFERMKISYIRDIKIHRLNFGLAFTLMWMLAGISLFLIIKAN